jgi:hypothetical protein
MNKNEIDFDDLAPIIVVFIVLACLLTYVNFRDFVAYVNSWQPEMILFIGWGFGFFCFALSGFILSRAISSCR